MPKWYEEEVTKKPSNNINKWYEEPTLNESLDQTQDIEMQRLKRNKTIPYSKAKKQVKLSKQPEKQSFTQQLKNFALNKPSQNKFFDTLNNISRVGANTVMGATQGNPGYNQPINTGSKVLDIGSSLVGTIGGLATPLGGGKSLLGAGINLGDDVVARASGKVTNRLGKELLRGAVAGGVIDSSQGLKEGDSPGQIAKRVGTGALIGAPLDLLGYGIGKGVSKALSNVNAGKYVQVPVDDAIGEVAMTTRKTPISKTLKPLKENKELTGVINEYNEAIGTIQNYFKTNELRTNEQAMIKPVLGIDLDDIMKRWQQAQSNPVSQIDNIRNIGQNRRLSQVAGVQDIPNTPLRKPVELPRVNQVDDIARNIDTPRVREIPDNMEPRPEGIIARQIEPPRANRPRINDEVAMTSDTLEAPRFVRELIDRNPVKKKSFENVSTKLRTQFVDDMAAFEGIEKEIRGSVGSAENSLYKQARLYKGVPEKAMSIVDTELKPIIKEIEKAGFDYQDLGDYAVAVHARDVNKEGINSGLTNEQITNTINKFSSPEMEQARKKLIGLSNKLIDDLADSGRISKEQVKAMRSKWENYMPLFRSFDDDKVEFTKGLSSSFSNVSSPIKALKGSDRAIVDPIESMMKNIYKTTDAAERNRVGLQLSKLATEDIDNTLIRKLSEGEAVGRKNVVGVYEGGEKVQYEVQPDVYKAMNDLNKESSNLLLNMLSKPASVLRAGATLTPEFAVRNPMRDVVNAFVVSKSGFNPVVDFPMALANVIKKDDIYYQWLKDSGGYGNILSMDRQAHRKNLEGIIKQSPSEKFVNVLNPKQWLNVMRAISDTTESATKLGEYRRALKSGTSRSEAAYRSRDLMDFARSGSSIRPANRIVAFLNANIQGKSKLIRAIKENPAKVSAKAAISMAIPSVGFFVAQQQLANDKQRQLIDNSPDWLKDTFWLTPIPGTNQVARIPKPFDVAMIANSVEKFLDYTVKNDKEAFDNFAKNTLKEQSVPVMLTGITPFIEGMTNYSFFRQSSIVPMREENLNQEDQFDINTSETSKILSGLLRPAVKNTSFENFGSPRITDNALRTTAGGLGNYALDAVDTFLGKTGVTEKKEKPKKNVSQKPVIRSFLVNENQSSKALDFLYTQRDNLTDEKGSSKLKESEFKQNPKLKYINEQLKRVSEVSKDVREVTNSKTISPEEKQRNIKELIEIRNRIANEARDYIKNKEK